ncbi:MAG: TIM barrel protein [Candidatus Woesearchaeota archaeon]
MRIGVAGSGGNYKNAFSFCKAHGISALEVAFTHGVRMSREKAREVGKLAVEYGIQLSVHAPYYVNLASIDEEKQVSSVKRVLDSCDRAYYLGARCVVFHPGFYQKRNPDDVYPLIKRRIKELMESVPEGVVLCPETTGKVSQFGTLEELLRLQEETGCGICVDFAHMLARYGSVDYKKILEQLSEPIHAHFSGIQYGDKGEIRHIPTDREEARRLLRLCKNKDITIINEGPDPFGEAAMMMELWP